MTRLRVLDSHFHAWDLDKQNLPWLSGTDGSITKTYTVGGLRQAYESEGLDLVGSVYVEVDGDDPLLEDSLAFALKDQAPIAHVMRTELAPHARVPLGAAGIREPLHVPEKPRGRCNETGFIEGVKALGAAGIVFDVCMREEELADLVPVVQEAKDTTFVIDHLGNASSMTSPVVEALRELGKFSNVAVKVSGFPTADAGFVRDLLTLASESFSPEQLLFASNWPVVELYSTFADHVRAVRDFFGDREDLFVTNAARVYGLSDAIAEGGARS